MWLSRNLSLFSLASLTVIVHVSLALAGQKWDMPLSGSATSFHSENAARFARDVSVATRGALEIEIHPEGSLIKDSEIFRAVRNGQVPIGERLMSALGNEDAIFEVDALPFLTTSFADAKKLYQSSRPTMEAILRIKGMMLLYAIPWPPHGLYAKTPINSLDDMKGVAFHADNAATSRMAELMGAIPTQVEAAKLSQAFASGIATTMISSGLTGYNRKIWKHVKFWYDAFAWLPKNMVMVNLEAWNRLDAPTRDVVLQVAREAEDRGWAKAEELATWSKQKLVENGMMVATPSDRLTSDFRQIGKQMMNDWLERAGAQGRKVINDYNKM